MPSDRPTPAGASARAEYERRKAARLARHRRRFGRLAGITARLDGEPPSERAWRRGAEGEERVGRRLDKLLRDSGVAVLSDLGIPGTRANIDHVCVGPGGVTVIDTKRYRGKARVRGGKLWVGSRDRTRVVDGVIGQVAVVRETLAADDLGDVEIRGAICWVEVEGLPLVRRLTVDGVRIDGPRPIAKLARRSGPLREAAIQRIAACLARSLARERGN